MDVLDVDFQHQFALSERHNIVWGLGYRAMDAALTDSRFTQTPVSPAPGVTIFPRIVANPDLESEEMLAYELGYRMQTTPAFSVDAALFYNVYDELKVFAPQGATTLGAPAGTRFQILAHQNQMRGETHGFELGAKWNPLDWWQLYAAYSLLRMSLHADAGLPAMNRATSEAAERQSPSGTGDL